MQPLSYVFGIKMKKLLLATFSLLSAQSTISMTCMTENIEKRFESAHYVFEATVKSRVKLNEESDGVCWSEGESCGSKIATVEIGEVRKGKFDSLETSIYSEDACYCLGTYFPVGAKYIVFGKESDNDQYNVYDMGACWTESYEHADTIFFKNLEKLKKQVKK